MRREYLRQFDSGAQKKARAWPFLGAGGVRFAYSTLTSVRRTERPEKVRTLRLAIFTVPSLAA